MLIEVDPALFPVPALMVLTLADREEAVAGWEKLRALAHRRGSLLGVLSVNLWSGRTLLFRGELREAQERLESANERFAEWGRTRSRETYGPAFLAPSGSCAATSPARARRSRRGRRSTTAATASRTWSGPAPSWRWRRATSPPPWS